MRRAFPYCLRLYCPKTKSLTELGMCYFHLSGWLVSSQDLPLCNLPSTPRSQCWDYRCMRPCLTFYTGTGNLSSGPHACVAVKLAEFLSQE